MNSSVPTKEEGETSETTNKEVLSPILEEVDWEVVQNEASVNSSWGDLKWLKGCNSLDKAEYGRHPAKQCVDVMFELQRDVLVVTSKAGSGIFGRGSSRNVHHLASIEAIHSSNNNRKLVQIEFNIISSKNFGTRHFFEATNEESAHYWIMNLKRRLREFTFRKKCTITDLVETEMEEEEKEEQKIKFKETTTSSKILLKSQDSSPKNVVARREPSIDEARKKFFRDCRDMERPGDWIDLGFLWRRTDRLLSGFMLRHFRVCKSSLMMEYRCPDNRRHFDIVDQSPRGYYYLKDAKINAIDSSNGNFQIVMTCGTERSLDMSRHVGLTLRAPTKKRFDILLRTLCSFPSVQFCVNMMGKGAKHTLLSAPSASPIKVVKVEDEEDEEEKEEEEEKLKTGGNDEKDKGKNESKVLPSAILSRFLGESVKYVGNREVKTKRSTNRFVPSLDRISGLKITEYMANRLENISTQKQEQQSRPRKKSESSPKRLLQGFRRLLSKRSFSKTTNASFSSTNSSSSSSSPSSTMSRLRGLSSASSTGSNSSSIINKPFDIGPMRLQSKGCEQIKSNEIVVMNVRVEEGNMILTPPHDLEQYVLVFPSKSVRVEMIDVWNLTIRLYVSKSISVKKNIEIEIQGWRDLPQQVTQLLAMMSSSGTQMCKRSTTFVEEMALVECHPAYFSYIEDHLKNLNAKKTLQDWQGMSNFFTSDEIKDAKYRIEREFFSYNFVKKYCDRSIVGGKKVKKRRKIDDDHVWKQLTGKNAIFVLGPSASGKTYSKSLFEF